MSMLIVQDPATGATIAEVPDDTAHSIAAKYLAARAAQPVWAAVPLSTRLNMLKRFRDALKSDVDRLAAVLTSETGKPIRQARNEINGLPARIDFFLDSTEAAITARDVHEATGMREQISHEPLGVIANISAWNYPYFVGGNVFVPALLTGNAVLYKPSEFATLSGIEIGALLHRCGVPQSVFAVLVGGGEIGSELIKQPVDGVFFTGSYATGQRIARELGPRMVKLQLELGGKDPIYVREDVDVASAAASLADGAMYNTGQSCCSVERIYVHQTIYEDFVKAFVKEVEGFKLGEPASEATYIGPITRAPQIDVLECRSYAVAGLPSLDGGAASTTRQLVLAGVVSMSIIRWRSCAKKASVRSSAFRKGQRRGSGAYDERNPTAHGGCVHDEEQPRSYCRNCAQALCTGTAATASARDCRGAALGTPVWGLRCRPTASRPLHDRKRGT